MSDQLHQDKGGQEQHDEHDLNRNPVAQDDGTSKQEISAAVRREVVPVVLQPAEHRTGLDCFSTLLAAFPRRLIVLAFGQDRPLHVSDALNRSPTKKATYHAARVATPGNR